MHGKNNVGHKNRFKFVSNDGYVSAKNGQKQAFGE